MMVPEGKIKKEMTSNFCLITLTQRYLVFIESSKNSIIFQNFVTEIVTVSKCNIDPLTQVKFNPERIL